MTPTSRIHQDLREVEFADKILELIEDEFFKQGLSQEEIDLRFSRFLAVLSNITPRT